MVIRRRKRMEVEEDEGGNGEGWMIRGRYLELVYEHRNRVQLRADGRLICHDERRENGARVDKE